MTGVQRRPPSENAGLIKFGLLALGTVASVIYIPAQLHARFFSEAHQWITPASPLTVIPDVLRGREPWTPVHTVMAVLVALIFLGFSWLYLRDARRRTAKREHIHGKAHLMGTGRELSLTAASEKVKQGSLASSDVSPGFMLARTIATGGEIWPSWRDGICALMGPGGGKTTGIAVPLVQTAPGSVFVTSNRRDICDIIRLGRESKGTFWRFDPQRIATNAGEVAAPWYWNVLSYVTDETKARKLAALFAANDKEDGAKSDPYFDAEGPQLLARLMLAAALDGQYLTQVFSWLAAVKFKEPMDILRREGFNLSAEGIEGIFRIKNSDQGIGVIGTAMKSIRFLDNRSAVRWIQPDGTDDTRMQFDPTQFVRAVSDTVVSLSKEGDGSFGPITAAMVMAILDAAEEYAEECGGRMPTPLLGMLDEAANICKIPDLPRKYSYYGGYGIFLVTILQNWSQGVLTWGEHGMQQLWSAATYGIVGAGIKDEKFLGGIVKGVGDHHAPQYSRSTSSGRNRSVSTSDSYHLQDIVSIADLQAIPPGTVIVSAMGSRPVMARVIPYWQRGKEMAEVCDKSKKTYAPKKVTA